MPTCFPHDPCRDRWPRTYDGSEPLEDFLRAGSDEKSPAPAVATAIAGPGEAPGELIKNMLQWLGEPWGCDVWNPIYISI